MRFCKIMHNIQEYIPHLHKIFWVVMGIVAIAKLSKLLEFLKECLSEPTPGCERGKGSSKRLILFMFASAFVYGWIHSIHANTKLDPYVTSFIIVFLLLGLAIIKPDQAGNLLDKLKSLTTFKADDDKKEEKIPIVVNNNTEIKA